MEITGAISPDLEAGLADVLVWVSHGNVLGQRVYWTLPVPGSDAGGTVKVIAWPEMDLRAHFVVVRNEGGGEAYLHTAFPAAAAGCRHRMRIDSIHEFCSGLEARISAVLGDTKVTFFDPRYCMNRGRYSPGALVDVGLAGIAYSLKIVPRGTMLRTAVGEVPMEGAAMFCRRGKESMEQAGGSGEERGYGVAYNEHQDSYPLPDEYEFCAPVKAAKETEIAEIPV
jgi:hypothetical protein